MDGGPVSLAFTLQRWLPALLVCASACSPASASGVPQKNAPAVQSAADGGIGGAQVRGSLDKEIIRGIIRRHLNEIKFCYEKALLKESQLRGRVMIQFTIAGTGAVVASVVQSSTLGNEDAEHCIADAVLRWQFPPPQGGGIVIVSYPFVLKAADSPPDGGSPPTKSSPAAK